MNDVSTPITHLIEKYLDLSASRHKVLVENIANIDTPGYRTKDLNFQGELQRAISDGNATMTPVARNVQGLLERPDGNNVNLDRESLLLAETQMQYGLATQLVRHEFQRLLSAIHEGSR